MGRIDTAQTAFTEIYERKLWGQGGTGRGIEFSLENIYRYGSLIQNFMYDNQVASVVEFGCGGFAHLRFLNWDGIEYDGFDVVRSIVESNIENYSAKNIRFHVVDNDTVIPSADLLIAKTVFQHLPNDDVIHYLALFKRLYKYILITDDAFPDENLNGDIEHGGFRAIRLDLPPFNERCAVLQRMTGSNFFQEWIKYTYLIFGDAGDARPTGAKLSI